MDELTIEADYLRDLIYKVRALMAREQNVTPDPGGNATDDAGPETLQETADDLSREELVEEFQGLGEDKTNQLVALMWLGRGDGDAEEWDELLQTATDRGETPDVDYLLDHPLVADYWALGLEKLGHGSEVVVEGEY